MHQAEKCPCGHQSCRQWHVTGVAQVQGVRFTETEAKAVAALLSDGDLLKKLRDRYELEDAASRARDLEFRCKELTETVQELMTPSGAGNVLEANVSMDEAPEAVALREALRAYGEKHGWT